MNKTIEQKAKAYDEAIERANDILKGYDPKEGSKATINYIFPGLTESENKRIRKVLIEGFKRYDDEFLFNGCLVKEILSWLEEQKDYIKLPNSAYTSNRDVIEFADEYSHTVWEKLMNKFKENENYNIGCNDVSDIVLNAIINTYNWLEKQGQQKVPVIDFKAKDWYVSKVDGKIHNIYYSVDKVQPKFKVGDWVVHDISDGRKVIRQIINMTNKSYILDGEDFNTFYFNDLENDYHLWTIQDAKDGDVLASNKSIFIFQKEYIGEKPTAYCGLMNGLFIEGKGACWTNEKCYPATKEQCDLLFQKMHEAGYTIDFKKKELRKLKFKVGDEVITKNEESLIITRIDKEGYWSNDLFICGFDDSDEWELVEQRPEWGEEDKQNLNAVLSYINDEYLRRWLKDAIHKKYDKHTEWSEEDESMYTRTIGILGKCYMGQLPTKVEDELNWLKSLKSKL